MDPPDFDRELSELFSEKLTPEMLSGVIKIAQEFSQGEDSQQNNNRTEDGGFSIDPEMLMKLMSLFEKLQKGRNDPRCNLIKALKPLLSPPRQKKADTAIELMKIFSLLSEGDIFQL